MPLARFALHADGEQVHVAAQPEVPETHQLASRHYAIEGRCFVLCAGSLLRTRDIPDDEDLRTLMFDGLGDLGGGEEVILPGGSGIIAPTGEWISGPATAEPQIVYGEIDLDMIQEEQFALDSAGHYHRPDLFRVSIRRDPLDPTVTEPSP